MKKLALLLTGLTLFALSAVAQSVVLCEDYNKTTGEPSGIYKTWDIKSDGGFIYILYQQPRRISSGSWYLYIDKDWDDNGKYSAYETIELDEETDKTWIMYDFKFTEKGKYKVDIMKDGVSQATTYCTIQFAAGEEGQSSSDDDEEVDTYYYENSEIVFCESVSADGDPEYESTEFKADRTGSRDVTIYLSNDKAFKTTKMYIDIYDAKSNEKIDDYSVDVESDWDWVKFKHTFTRPGEYYVDIYNADDIFINTASLKIIR